MGPGPRRWGPWSNGNQRRPGIGSSNRDSAGGTATVLFASTKKEDADTTSPWVDNQSTATKYGLVTVPPSVTRFPRGTGEVPALRSTSMASAFNVVLNLACIWLLFIIMADVRKIRD